MISPIKSVFSIATAVALLGMATPGLAVAPKMKMTTDIPESMVIPDELDTRIGKLKFFDGFPSAETANKALDYLDFHRGVDVFLDEMRAASMFALREGHREVGVTKFN